MDEPKHNGVGLRKDFIVALAKSKENNSQKNQM